MAETWKFPEAVEKAKRDVASMDGCTANDILDMVRQERTSLEDGYGSIRHGITIANRREYAAAYEHAARNLLHVKMLQDGAKRDGTP